MKYFVCLLLLVLAAACTTGENTVGIINPPSFKFDFTGYGERLEPAYVKIFSDSSWEEYGGVDTVKGTGYLSTLTNDSSRYYYTLATRQYAGYRIAGQAPVIFDVPLPLLPAHWSSDTSFSRTATFTAAGYSVSITDAYTLLDTAAVVTPLGNFSPAPHFLDETYVTVSDGEAFYGSQEFWAARGPGVIITAQSGQSAVYFIRGDVNGIAWGSSTTVQRYSQGDITQAVGVRGLFLVSRSDLLRAIARRKGLILQQP